MSSRPRVLTVAGTDPTGGAGIAADLKTFAAHGAYGAAVVTAIVVQDTLGVRSVHVPPVEVLRDQLDAVAGDVVLDAVKIGMLGSVENAQCVANWLDALRPAGSGSRASQGPGERPGKVGASGRRPFVVLDPVLAASSGGTLSRDPDPEMLDALRDVAARADVVTPNLGELAALVGEEPVRTWADALAQAARLAERLDVRVLVTGGHLATDRSPDALVEPGGATTVLDGPRLDVAATHGTGCGLSSALAALRPVRGSWTEAARDAKTWLAGALVAGEALDVGRGPGPVDHLYGIAAPGVPVRDRLGVGAGASGRPARLLLIAGRSWVGKSSVAFALHDLLTADEIAHAVVEGDALDLAWPAPWEHRLAERNLAEVWENYRALGHDRLVYTNTVSVLQAEALAAAVGPGTEVTSVLLTGTDEAAGERLAARERGATLAAHVERSAAAARRLDDEAPATVHRVATDGLSALDVARVIRGIWMGT